MSTSPSDGATPEPLSLAGRTRRHRRNVLIGTAILLVIIGAFGLWLRQMSARQIIVGKHDPKTGLYATFTLSKRWKRKMPEQTLSQDPYNHMMFVPASPSPVQTWISVHILRQRQPFTGEDQQMALLFDGVEDKKTESGVFIQDGYPTFNLNIMPPGRQERLTVAGQPATWWEFSTPSTPSTFIAGVIVKVRDKPLWYSFGGSGSSADAGLLREEVREVIRSFRIEEASSSSPTH